MRCCKKENHLWIQPGSKLGWGYGGEGWLPGGWQVVPVGVEEEIEDEAVDQPLIVVEQPHTVSQLLSNLLYMSLVADNHGWRVRRICSRFWWTSYCRWRVLAVTEFFHFVPAKGLNKVSASAMADLPVSVFMLDTGWAGPTLGQTQLKVVTHTEEKHCYSLMKAPDKEDIVALGSPVENLLKTWPLLRPETAAYAILIRATTGCHLGGICKDPGSKKRSCTSSQEVQRNLPAVLELASQHPLAKSSDRSQT